MADTQGITLTRYLLSEQAEHPETEPEFWTLIAQMAYVAKVIARETRRAALVGRLGLVGERNSTGETQKKLDVFSNEAALSFRSWAFWGTLWSCCALHPGFPAGRLK